MKTPTRYQVEQLTLNFDALDRPQFSICPKCSSDIISLADGCRICGWSENQSSIDECSSKTTPPSKNCSSNITPPSKIPPSKKRRKKGEGTGYIYRRTITRRGKQYQEHYYRYRDESGKLRAKYIPQKLLVMVQEAESQSLSVADVLKLLGGDEISRGEQFSTSDDGNVLNSESNLISRGEQASPPSTKNRTIAKRPSGYGAGYIECRKVKRGSKLYSQYWYHYEIWSKGERVIKKSRYIPKRLVPKVERMNNEKVPVAKILNVLRNRSKSQKR